MLVLITVRTAALSATEISVIKCCFQGLTMLTASLGSVYLFHISKKSVSFLNE